MGNKGERNAPMQSISTGITHGILSDKSVYHALLPKDTLYFYLNSYNLPVCSEPARMTYAETRGTLDGHRLVDALHNNSGGA